MIQIKSLEDIDYFEEAEIARKAGNLKTAIIYYVSENQSFIRAIEKLKEDFLSGKQQTIDCVMLSEYLLTDVRARSLLKKALSYENIDDGIDYFRQSTLLYKSLKVKPIRQEIMLPSHPISSYDNH